MLTLWAPQAECLWDESLPVEVKELPADLAELDRVLWRSGVDDGVAGALAPGGRGYRTGGVDRWATDDRDGDLCQVDGAQGQVSVGYRVLVAEVSDSIHLRRFCRICLGERVPDESTVRKLTRRIGAETVNELTRSLIETALREKRFRPRAVRIDSTVVEADVRYPTDADLASHGVKVLAREGRSWPGWSKERKLRVRDRSRSMGRKLRALTRTIRRRSGEAKAEVLALTEQTGELLERSVTEARKLAAVARRRAVGRGAATKRRAAARLEELADLCEKVATQIRQRVAGEPITDRLVSIADPDARPIRKGKLGKPNEFGYVSQICEVTEHTRRGARGLIVPASTRLGNPGEDTLLPDTISELNRLGIRPREIALDGGFQPGPDPPSTPRTRPGARAGVHRRPPTTRQPTHPTTIAALPNRGRRPDQPPQTRLRDEPHPASKATKAARSGRDGRSWPTTLTRSPSELDETLNPARSTRATTHYEPAARDHSTRPFRFPTHEFFLGKDIDDRNNSADAIVGCPRWARTSDFAPVGTLDLAPLPSDREATLRVLWRADGVGGKDAIESGAVRADPEGSRVRGVVNACVGAQVWSASTDRASGVGVGGSAGAQAAGAAAGAGVG